MVASGRVLGDEGCGFRVEAGGWDLLPQFSAVLTFLRIHGNYDPKFFVNTISPGHHNPTNTNATNGSLTPCTPE